MDASITHWIKNPLRRTSEHNHRYNYLNFSVLQLKKSIFINFKPFFEKKNLGCNQIDFDVYFFFDTIIGIYKITKFLEVFREKKTAKRNIQIFIFRIKN